jgi:hypothetical protein
MVIPRDSLLFFNAAEFKGVLEQAFPAIEFSALDASFAHGLQVLLERRELFAVVCNDNRPSEEGNPPPPEIVRCVYIDRHGFAYDNAPHTRGPLLLKISMDREVLPLGETVIPAGQLERLDFFRDRLEDLIGVPIVGFRLRGRLPGEIRVVSAAGFEIYLNRDDDFENVYQVLERVLAKELREKRRPLEALEYLDLRFGNKAFLKFK